MSKTVWIEQTTDPATSEELVFEAGSEEELDAKIIEYFGRPGEADDEPGAGPS